MVEFSVEEHKKSTAFQSIHVKQCRNNKIANNNTDCLVSRRKK